MIKSSRTTTKASAVFLATVLLAGTIALSFPSFMIGSAQAQPYYGGGMDNDYKKSYGKDNRDKDKSKDSANVKKVKCNNINVNVNGIELNATSFPFLNGVAAEEDDGADKSIGSYGSYDGGSYDGGSYGKHSDKDKDGFTFVCINNNNNEVGGGNVTEPQPQPDEETCEECFALLGPNATAFIEEAIQTNITIGEFEFEGSATSTIEDFCEDLREFVAEEGLLELDFIDIAEVVLSILDPTAPDFEDEVNDIIDFLLCLVRANLIDISIDIEMLISSLTALPATG